MFKKLMKRMEEKRAMELECESIIADIEASIDKDRIKDQCWDDLVKAMNGIQG